MPDKRSDFDMIIDPTKVQKEYLKDLIRYRELFYFFAWRDIVVRYKQAFLGIAWAIIRPLLTMILFTFIFKKLAHLSSGPINYSLFVLAGMLPWQLCSASIIDTCNSLTNNAHLISKVYFPRIIIPTSQIIVHLVDFSIMAVLLTIFGLWSNAINYWTMFSLPIFLGLALLLCIGGGLWLSALTIKYHDFRFVIPLIVQFGVFISPVGYPSDLIPEQWNWLYFLNPMVGIIDGFRWAFFGISPSNMGFSLLFSVSVTLSLLISGFFYFRKTESTFADNI